MNEPMPAPAALPPFYYRDNFLRLCDTVAARYADLLEPDESAFLERICALPIPAQCLYVRLVSRVGPLFRESRLSYDELGNVEPLLDTLVACGLVVEVSALTVAEVAGLFTSVELQRAFAPLLAQQRFSGKAALLAGIEQLSLTPTDAREQLRSIDAKRIVAPAHRQTVELLQLLFFGNRHLGLTEFVLSDLGVARYYPYALDRDHRFFLHRGAVQEYLDCAALSERWYELAEEGELADKMAHAKMVLEQPVQYASSAKLWYRLCHVVAREMERLGEDDLALALYSRSDRHPARERRARILERTAQWSAAITLCDEMLVTPVCEEEQEAAQRIRARIRRRVDGIRATRRKEQFADLHLSLAQGEEPVELLAAQHLSHSWSAVHYVENALMNSLFGLAFWQEIFAPVPGVFHHPYQNVPDDMYDDDFVCRRRDMLERRFVQLESAAMDELLCAAYRRYYSLQCRWLDWRAISVELVEAVATVVPPAHLLAIWRRIMFDRRANRSGFPDLIALGGQPGDYCMIEVKGPGDTLQGGQKRWLRYFQAQDIPAAVAWVNWHDH